MLNFLSPPTDSFYKFLGIGGLLLFIVCGIFIFSTIYKDDYKLILAEGELQAQEYRLKIVIDDLEYLPQYKNLENVNIPKLKAWADNISDESYSSDSIFIQSYYSLPDSVRKEILSILFLRFKKQVEYDAINEQIMSRKRNENIVFIFCLFGEILAVVGIYLWYINIQKPLDEERKKQESQKHFLGTDLSPNCHSCSMTFYFQNERGTEKDGALNHSFCKECYDKGKYTEPDLTFDEAKERLIVKLNQLNYKSRRIKRAEKKLETLLRWKRLKTW